MFKTHDLIFLQDVEMELEEEGDLECGRDAWEREKEQILLMENLERLRAERRRRL